MCGINSVKLLVLQQLNVDMRRRKDIAMPPPPPRKPSTPLTTPSPTGPMGMEYMRQQVVIKLLVFGWQYYDMSVL